MAGTITIITRTLTNSDTVDFFHMDQDVRTIASPTFAGLTLSGLTASVPIVTDANKALTSLAYTGTASFRKNLSLETDDSPTFVTAKLTNLTDGYLPYHISDAVGLANSPIFTDETNVVIGAATGANLLTIQQTSATDPIADSWTVYSTRETKDILNQVTDYTSILDEFNHTPVHQWKRKLKKPLLADYIDIKQSTADEAGEKVEKITTIQEQYDIAFAEFQKKSSLPKFQQPKYSLVAEEAPEFVKSYDDTGKLVGIDLLAYVGWLHACLKGFIKGKL